MVWELPWGRRWHKVRKRGNRRSLNGVTVMLDIRHRHHTFFILVDILSMLMGNTIFWRKYWIWHGTQIFGPVYKQIFDQMHKALQALDLHKGRSLLAGYLLPTYMYILHTYMIKSILLTGPGYTIKSIFFDPHESFLLSQMASAGIANRKNIRCMARQPWKMK